MVRVTVRTGDRHWGWTAKHIPDNPPLYYNTVLGLWAFEVDGKEVKFKRPISIKKFDRYCELKESNYLSYWIYECDDNYINKLLSSKNAIIAKA